MTTSEEIEDYESLILSGVPFIDVRAPIEFSTGHLPNSHNLPLLFDDERVTIGKCYKHEGRHQAIALGHRLVSGNNKAEKIEAWVEFMRKNPDAVIYCARGGMRSKLTQQWLKDAGLNVPRVHLGYKGLRNYLLSVLETLDHPMIVLSGNTGTGKTDLLQKFSSTIDLEGLANHHGSAFGKNITPQPAQATFENSLAINCVQKAQRSIWLLEDESRCIGKVHLPETLHTKMAMAPLVIIDESLESRLLRIAQLYFSDMSNRYRAVYGEEDGWTAYAEYLTKGLSALQKRLGGVRFSALEQKLSAALEEQYATNSIEKHYEWLSLLLTDYYDPMYAYQLDKKKDRIIFRGDFEAVQSYLAEKSA